jgi:hypothetical protein
VNWKRTLDELGEAKVRGKLKNPNGEADVCDGFERQTPASEGRYYMACPT